MQTIVRDLQPICQWKTSVGALADSKGGPVGKEIVSVCSPSELGETIPFTTLHFSDYTMDLAYNADTVFTNLFLVAGHGSLCSIVAKLGGDSLQLATVSIVVEIVCYCTDCYRRRNNSRYLPTTKGI
jgi:hypothetical protein